MVTFTKNMFENQEICRILLIPVRKAVRTVVYNVVRNAGRNIVRDLVRSRGHSHITSTFKVGGWEGLEFKIC